jgi:hypothetical protein
MANSPASTAMNSGGGTKPNLQQLNAAARQAVLSQSVNMVQNVYSTGITGTVTSANSTINFSPRMVGALKRFFIEVSGTITNTGSTAASIARTQFGPANLLSQIVLTDLSNNTRINTTGAHLHLLATAKRGWPFGESVNLASTSSPVGFGSVATVNSAPATIPKTTGNTSTVTMVYEIPVTYSDTDLRGLIYLGVTGQTMNVQLNLNTSAVVASGDNLNAVYSGDTGTLSNVTINVYQHYLDQLPFGSTGPVLPVLDMSTLYMLNNTVSTGIVTNQDFPIPYANFRDFLSTIAVVDNGGARYAGTDVNYFALTAANFTNFLKVDPTMIALWTRNRMMVDFPIGTYYFDHRHRPISTNQFGNMELVFNLGTSGQALASGSSVVTMYEMFALVNLIGQAGSLQIG